ncbi:hypothetical protein EJ110_NYTH23614 [Nymphaea thermarum]|nr:hypothetical protein EJ110_NYTH23614 [Nymphaea thermarum]
MIKYFSDHVQVGIPQPRLLSILATTGSLALVGHLLLGIRRPPPQISIKPYIQRTFIEYNFPQNSICIYEIEYGEQTN